MLSRLITLYHALSSVFDRKLILVTTLKLVPSLPKSYPSCHILSRFITPYHTLFPCLIEH